MIRIAAVLLLVASPACAAPIMIGATTFELGIDAFPTSVSFLSGSSFAFGGISGEEGLTGADIDTGAFNLDTTDVLELVYSTPIVNQTGDDLYFTDSRFSADSLDFSIDGGTTFHTIAADDFMDTGVDSVIRNTSFTFSLFAATIDLSDFGVASGGSISSLQIRGMSESDPIVVGNLNADVGPAVPEPSALGLLLTALGSVLVVGLRRRATPVCTN